MPFFMPSLIHSLLTHVSLQYYAKAVCWRMIHWSQAWIQYFWVSIQFSILVEMFWWYQICRGKLKNQLISPKWYTDMTLCKMHFASRLCTWFKISKQWVLCYIIGIQKNSKFNLQSNETLFIRGENVWLVLHYNFHQSIIGRMTRICWCP
jgi:hypothetical protein